MYGELPQHTRPLGCYPTCYLPHYDSSNLTLTQNVKELKSQNDYTVNIILNSISERIAIFFGNTEIVSEMWETLLNRFKGNSQMKRTKLMV
jgi:SET domain-containing protein